MYNNTCTCVRAVMHGRGSFAGIFAVESAQASGYNFLCQFFVHDRPPAVNSSSVVIQR